MIKTDNFLFGLKGIFIFLLIFNINYAQTDNVVIVRGKIVDSNTDNPIPNANVYSGDIGTVTDEQGGFILQIPGNSEIIISVIGYEKKTIVATDSYITVFLERSAIKGEEVIVLANRAIAGVTPVAFSTLTQDEISVHYTVEDVPMILATEPGVYAYSESGNGTGYSYISIRGFDQSRISVMLDNVPLNDNESHQVYWVDHSDILNDAVDVQIQRGIGSSVYGAAAFGGSVNVLTNIRSEEESIIATGGAGSYNTTKYSLQYKSGKRFGDQINLSARLSQVESDGYREFHHSLQQAFSLGFEFRTPNMTNRFRALIGYENTDLLWDGVYGNDINDRSGRRKGYKGFTDDFLQQIYSLNTQLKLSKNSYFHNVIYLVRGRGYYEAEKFNKSFYKYNLDTITDTAYLDSTTNLLRRKWIVNRYYGLIPQWTLKTDRIRLDLGGEFRFYEGDHFGRVTDFSNPLLNNIDEFKYYQYLGTKTSITGFAHMIYDMTKSFLVTLDLQFLRHDWQMDQKPIGHAAGYEISADWNFFNPRAGFLYRLTKYMSLFGSYGKAEKEPADDQIINADEWEFTPKGAYPELIYDSELGLSLSKLEYQINLNLYTIELENEVMESISFEEEGYYEYSQAEGTIHRGVEFDAALKMNENLLLSVNTAFSKNFFSAGDLKGNLLPNQPGILANLTITYSPLPTLIISAYNRFVGKRYIDNANTGDNAINDYYTLNVGASYRFGPFNVTAKVNNLLDTLYVTHGENWGWGWIAYWPGATRDYFVSVSYSL